MNNPFEQSGSNLLGNNNGNDTSNNNSNDMNQFINLNTNNSNDNCSKSNSNLSQNPFEIPDSDAIATANYNNNTKSFDDNDIDTPIQSPKHPQNDPFNFDTIYPAINESGTKDNSNYNTDSIDNDNNNNSKYNDNNHNGNRQKNKLNVPPSAMATATTKKEADKTPFASFDSPFDDLQSGALSKSTSNSQLQQPRQSDHEPESQTKKKSENRQQQCRIGSDPNITDLFSNKKQSANLKLLARPQSKSSVIKVDQIESIMDQNNLINEMQNGYDTQDAPLPAFSYPTSVTQSPFQQTSNKQQTSKNNLNDTINNSENSFLSPPITQSKSRSGNKNKQINKNNIDNSDFISSNNFNSNESVSSDENVDEIDSSAESSESSTVNEVMHDDFPDAYERDDDTDRSGKSKTLRSANDENSEFSTKSSKSHKSIKSKKSERSAVVNEEEEHVDKKKTPEYAEKTISIINQKIEIHEKKIARLKRKRDKFTSFLTPDQKSKLLIVNDEDGKGTKKTEIKDALQFMIQGSSMLKYGRFGYPHFRHFEVTPNCDKIIWYSTGKSIDKTTIDFSKVESLQIGQLTSVFRKHAQPRLNKCSFSLVYSNGSKTLDVIAKNRREFTLWTTGLTKLIEYNRKKRKHRRHNIPLPTCINVRVQQRNQEIIEKKLNAQPDPPRKMVEKELEMANNEFKKVNELMRNDNVCHSLQFSKILQKTAELEKDLERANQMIENKSLSVASHEIWRTCVEIKALDNKLTVLSKMKH